MHTSGCMPCTSVAAGDSTAAGAAPNCCVYIPCATFFTKTVVAFAMVPACLQHLLLSLSTLFLQ